MVSMLNPMRVVEGNSSSYISIETKDGKEVMKTESILIKNDNRIKHTRVSC